MEVTLAIVGPDASAVADRLAALDELGGCTLEPRPARRLRDVYLDREDGELRRAGVALRIRFDEAGTPVLGLKSGGRRLEAGGVERREREEAWGEEALEVLRAELERAGLSAPTPAPDPSDPPLEALDTAGLRVVQDRVTLRRPARLVREGSPVGELAVDEVRYRVAGRTIVHREVEVEAAEGEADPRGLVSRAARELADRFGPALRPWDRAKLATGRALERLAEEETGVPLDGEDGLPAELYDRLEETIESEPAGA